MGNKPSFSKKTIALPSETTFKFPSPLPQWPPGEGFASGVIDLGGGLKVCQITTFNKTWSTYEGGPDNLGATFFDPSPIPKDFFMLGSYSQPNNKPLHGWILAAKADENYSNQALQKPLDYTLIWSTQTLNIKQDGYGYFWLPIAPNGYKVIGIIVTSSPEKPSIEKIRCIRSDLTDEHCISDSIIWRLRTQSQGKNDGLFSVHSLTPTNRGIHEMSVRVGTFGIQNSDQANSSNIACLKNSKSSNIYSSMPNLTQINALFQAYAPYISFHPKEKYFPSSVTWFFKNGALLYKKGEESNPVQIDPTGSNLPQGGSNDGAYWLDLPADEKAQKKVKKGDLQDCQVYLHIKPAFGATFTDIAIWVFYPFNGPARAKVKFLNIPLGKIGEHVGDWEHLTLRISNFNGEIFSVYFSEHSKGKWVDASELEFQRNGNRFMAYASLNGHSFYPRPGLVLQGSGGVGIRNETARNEKTVMDCGVRWEVIAAEYLGEEGVRVPPWVNYCRKWGPKISYQTAAELKKVEKILPGRLKSLFVKKMMSLPSEVFGEEGPTGPKMKISWTGDESS